MTAIDPLVSDEEEATTARTEVVTRDGAYLDVIDAFGAVAAAIGDSRDLDDLLHMIARKICELVGVRRCSLYLRDEASGLYRGQVGHWVEDIDQGVKRLVSGVEADRFTAQILETKRPVVVQDTRMDPRPIKSTMRDWHVRSMLGVPMIVRDEVIGIVYLDDADRARLYDDGDAATAFAFADLAAVAISHAQLTADLRQRLTTVGRQNRALRRAATVEDRLTTLAVDGCTVQEIAEAVAELTDKAVSVHDASHRRVAAAAAPNGDAASLPRLLDPEVRANPRVAQALEAASGGEPIVVGPLLEAGLYRRTLLAPVRVRGEVWGSLVIAEHQTRLTSVDMQIGRRAATIVAWEMGVERRAIGDRSEARSNFAAELLRGRRDLPALERKAEYLGFQSDLPRVVCLLSQGVDGAAPPESQVAAAFGANRPDADVLVTELSEGVAVIVGVSADASVEDIEQTVGAACATLGAVVPVRAAVSEICHSLDAYPAAWGAARDALHCLRTLCPPGRTVLSASELGPVRVLFATSNAADLDRFAHEALGPLLAGGAGERNLLDTLVAFIDQGRNVRGAAAALALHENTVRYRLSRIEELTGLRVFTDAGDQLSAQLAVVTLRLSGALDG